ncbi:MAG: prolyl oligopeptidase family serine peptidase [Acidobacteria bacterium]|nr:prolyl oligopeptidase family serine peptidase [Acidobacteriota bacterium]
MSYNVNGLVHHTVRGVEYLPDGRVFYRDPGVGGTQYMIAGPGAGGGRWTTAPAFDNAKLAAALTDAMGDEGKKTPVEAGALGVTGYAAEANGGFAVTTRDGVFHCDASVVRCTKEPEPPSGEKVPDKADTAGNNGGKKKAAVVARRHAGTENVSPDKTMAAFIRDNNLWVRTVATGAEKQLTADGVEDFGYATDNAGWQHSDAAILTWSADGKKIATFQQDQRRTGMMYLVPTTDRHPVLEAWRYPLVGDKDVTMIEPVVIDVATAKVVRLKTPPMEHRSMECDDVSCDGDGKWNDVAFSEDDAHLGFVATSRDHKDEYVREADTATGAVREVYHEHVDTYYGWQSKTDWKYMPELNEFLWVSERSDWAQLYLYDLTTGKLKNQITHGDGPVADVKAVDEKNRVIYFMATGKEKGEDPYFQNYYRVDFDGKNQRLLTPEVATHDVTAAKDGSTFVDVYSTVNTPQTAVLRDSDGRVLVGLGKQDISALLAEGWKAPERVEMKARDGVTPIYGIMFKPTTFDAAKKYPVVDYVYPGPQDGSCSVFGPPGFEAARGDLQAMADLGFVVVCIDGMGNPHRSKSFHDAYADSPAVMGQATIPDQVAGIKDLASKDAWIDLDRVGITGHSGGGNATASAMFHFPDFFKVGWAESGNHDQREYEDDWDERWAGLEVIGPDGQDNYAAQANEGYAKNLKGHLMLVHGTMDDNVPPNNTLLVVDALIKANKDFDMLMIPNVPHGYMAATPYVMKRRWDYFVRYLAGGVPAMDFQPKSYAEIVKAYYAAQ